LGTTERGRGREGCLTLEEAEVAVEGGLEGDVGGGGGHGGGDPRRKVLAGFLLRAWCRVFGREAGGRRTGEGGDGSGETTKKDNSEDILFCINDLVLKKKHSSTLGDPYA
jgi:hypothetical protein